jgi:phosphomannomutase
MMERPIFLGGEESGAIGIGAHLPERDGIANALLLAEITAASGKGPRACMEEIFADIGHFTYERADHRVSPVELEEVRLRAASLTSPARLCGRPVTGTDRTDGLKFLRDDFSWLLLRVSGTEPLVRIYAEAATREEALDLLAEGRRLLGV